MRAPGAARFVGSSVTRVEDDRLLAGKGRYVADLDRPGLLHAAFLRSSEPHARLTRIDVAAARRLNGVIAVITGAEMKRITNPFLNLAMVDGLYSPLYWALAVDRVRMVGDPIAIVVAESRYVAEDALELIDVEYEPLEAIATIEAALDTTKPKLWDRAVGNVLMNTTKQYGDVAAAFAAADRVITRTFDCHRHSNQPMETRGCVAEIDAATAHADLAFGHAEHPRAEVVRGSRHGPAVLLGIGRLAVAAPRPSVCLRRGHAEVPPREPTDAHRRRLLGIRVPSAARPVDRRAPPARRPRAHREGRHEGAGGRGAATSAVPLGAKASSHARRSRCARRRWSSGGPSSGSRTATSTSRVGGHARDERMRVAAAVKDDGEVLAFRVDLTLVDGAYPAAPVPTAMFAMLMRVMMPGVYRLRAFEFNTRIVCANKGPYVPYRGPWAVETWVRERMLDVIARELGMSPAELRLRNMVTMASSRDRWSPARCSMSACRRRATLDKALELADLERFRVEQADGPERGPPASESASPRTIEAAPGPPGFMDHVLPGGPSFAEPAHTVLEDDGTVSVYIQQMPHGQSHETTFAQVAADELGVPLSDVTVRFGDTRVTPFGLFGTGGSRAGAMTGGAVTFAARDAARAGSSSRPPTCWKPTSRISRSTDGAIHVAGVPAISVSFADIARATPRPARWKRRQRATTAARAAGRMATHVCWVDVDLETGFVKIPRYVVVEDCGELINPAIVEGQIRGGVAQGVGAVLYEKHRLRRRRPTFRRGPSWTT